MLCSPMSELPQLEKVNTGLFLSMVRRFPGRRDYRVQCSVKWSRHRILSLLSIRFFADNTLFPRIV